MSTDAFVLQFPSHCVPLRSGETVVGRSVYCSVVVRDGSISRVHATLMRADDGVVVTDMESKNGTFVNDVPVHGEPIPVRIGDAIRFGDVSCTLTTSATSRETAGDTDRSRFSGDVFDEVTDNLVSSER